MNPNMKQIPSYEFRRRAMAAIKPVMSVLAVVGLLAALPGLIEYVVCLVTGADPAIYTEPVMLKINAFVQTGMPLMSNAEVLAESDALMQELTDAYQTFMTEKGAIYFGMLAMQLLLTPALSVALHGGLLDAVGKREVTLPGMLSRLRLSPKALVLFLWMLLRIYAWMLPGMAVMLVSVFLPVSVALLLMLAGMVLAIVLGIRALLHYSLAPIALIDDPSLSLNGCIAASHEVMHCRKMEMFSLEVSFIGWMLLLQLLRVMFTALFGGVIGMALGMMAELLLNVYISGARVCFYTAYSGGEESAVQRGAGMEQEDMSLN